MLDVGNPVWNVGREGDPTMNRQGGYVQKATQIVDTLYRLRYGTHRGINDGAPTAHAWDGAGG